ncbi:IS256 family transposase [Microbispora sp. SCL1-1]|uniref:IS256 family transposase n=1 Tax=unclassified Microbispora TaxID=2614687 RepID=UPI001159BC67|nr:IS256 family transposase [Microbispora sp. SCL1-1]NJP26225.1 IS256 family transposase [Microbispora sp. CL1-1]TQS12649.1 IS256 family transposase [Microbispora sp. SCL1-1]
MARTLPPVQAIRAEIDALFAEGRDLVEVIEDVARLGARLIIQTAVEAEVDAFLGRARYQRAAAADDGRQIVRPGHRNGHCPTTIKTTTGLVTIARPKLRGTTEKFASRLFGTGVTRTNALETLVIASFVRGLSVRDVEGALADALGPEAALSKSTVSAICQAIVTEYDAWCHRDLHGVELDYLSCDASHFKMHDGQRAEPILAAWGITTDGKPVFIGLAPAAAESTDAWHDFLTGLAARGLRPPLLVISDGAPGLITAAEQVFPASLRQRCVIHKCRNVLSKVSAGDQAEVKAAFWDIFDTSGLQQGDQEIEPGQDLVAWVQRRIDAFADTWGARYPAAVKSLLADRASLTTYLRFPLEHHKRIRHSNFIERTFGETRRRVKVIGRFPGETSCVSLVWAVLDRAARGWRGFTMTSKGLRILQDLRRVLLTPPSRLRPATTPATDSTPETAAA